MVASAAKLNLDTLTLQTRAVRAMLELDRKTARKLFLEINPPPASLNCEQRLTPDMTSLYEALALVANSTFTEQERKKEEHLNLVLTYMARAASPLEIAPMEKMIGNLNISSEQREVLQTRLDSLRQSLQALVCPDEKTTDEVFWTSDAAKHIYEGGVRLRNTDAVRRDTPEWYEQLAAYLKDVGEWSPSDEKDAATYFHEKAIVYEMLVELIPHGPDRDKAILAFVDFVANSTLQREKPAEWFSHAQSLITRAQNLNIEPEKIWTAFENSGNPVLMLYTRLTHLAALRS